ncbi:oligopeptide:H+ symporter [Microbacterium sp. CCNWLW134]|uniref:oligopeptide:H+ symporter n=1 Tax=Microbacterium sp. CCNWLW134 TaxID=3122064 RepID=UPI0030103900
MATVSDSPTTKPRTFLGLPLTAYLITGFTAFDALAFYGMQTLLVYYVYFSQDEGGIGLPTDTAIGIVSAFGATTFLATIFGGWLADRVLGSGRALRYGAFLAVVGYGVLALLPGPLGVAIGLVALTLAASSLWVSEGALMDGALQRFESKREAGFTVYYLGSAAGAVVGITFGGILQTEFGFRIGFLASAISILIGLAVYLPARRSIEATAPSRQGNLVRGWRLAWPILAATAAITTLVAVVAVGFNPSLVITIGASAFAITAFTRYLRSPRFTPSERRNVLHYLPFNIATLFFALLYQQLFTSVAVHSESATDRFVFGVEIPPSTVLGFAPLCTVVVAPLLAAIWGRLGDRQPALSTKFAVAFGVCALAIGLFAASAGLSPVTPLLILVLVVVAFGASDVVISPSGISLAAEVAPPGHESRLLSLHYVSVSIGIALAGVIAQWYTPGQSEGLYFGGLALMAAAVALGMVIARVRLGRRIVA